MCDHRIQIHQDDFARTRICMVCYHYSQDDGLTWSTIALAHPKPGCHWVSPKDALKELVRRLGPQTSAKKPARK